MTIAADILAALTSYYPFDADLNDVHGTNHINTSVTSAGFATGKVGNMLSPGSRGYCTLASAISHAPTTGSLTVGGWFKYATPGGYGLTEFGLSYSPYNGSQNEAFTIFSTSDGKWGVFGWNASSGTYGAIDPNERKAAYPITVRVQDSTGATATSDQVIRISGSGGAYAAGWFFVVGTWESGIIKLYVDGSLVFTSSAAPASVKAASVPLLQVGNGFLPALTQAGLDGCFFSDHAALTLEQIQWLYNSGLGRTYAEISGG